MKFILPMPPSINQTYGVSREGQRTLYKRKSVKDWEELAGWEIKKQYKGKIEPFMGKVKVTINWFNGIARETDIDAGIKVLLDLFQKQLIYINDRQVKELHVYCKNDIDSRAEVIIENL